jgi:hypothetical protein
VDIMKRLLSGLLAVGVLACSPAWAHHSFAMFEPNKVTIVKGTILSWTYMNPHSWLSVVGVADGAGAPRRWDVEATSPRSLAKLGVLGGTLKPGDKITAGIHPLRDGSPGGAWVFVVTTDGKVYGAQPSTFGLDIEKLKPEDGAGRPAG